MELQDKGKDGAYCLLRCKSTMYLPVHWSEGSQFFLFFWVVFGECSLVRLTYCYLDVHTYVIANTVGS